MSVHPATGPAVGAGPRRPRTPAARRRMLGLERDAWFLLLPALIPVLVLSVGPLLYGLGLAFTDAQSGVTRSTSFTGLRNLADLRLDSLFWQSFRIGLLWAVCVTALQFVLSLGLATEALELQPCAPVMNRSAASRFSGPQHANALAQWDGTSRR